MAAKQSSMAEDLTTANADEAYCNNYRAQKLRNTNCSNLLLIKKISATTAQISLSRVVTIANGRLGPQPYYCELSGLAEMRNESWVFFEDMDKYSINGIYLTFSKDEIVVHDDLEIEHELLYCGAHVSLDDLRFNKTKDRVQPTINASKKKK